MLPIYTLGNIQIFLDDFREYFSPRKCTNIQNFCCSCLVFCDQPIVAKRSDICQNILPATCAAEKVTCGIWSSLVILISTALLLNRS